MVCPTWHTWGRCWKVEWDLSSPRSWYLVGIVPIHWNCIYILFCYVTWSGKQDCGPGMAACSIRIPPNARRSSSVCTAEDDSCTYQWYALPPIPGACPLVLGCLPRNPKLTSRKAKLVAYLNTPKSSVESNESAGTKLLSDIEKELLVTDKLLKGVLNCIDKCEKQIWVEENAKSTSVGAIRGRWDSATSFVCWSNKKLLLKQREVADSFASERDTFISLLMSYGEAMGMFTQHRYCCEEEISLSCRYGLFRQHV